MNDLSKALEEVLEARVNMSEIFGMKLDTDSYSRGILDSFYCLIIGPSNRREASGQSVDCVTMKRVDFRLLSPKKPGKT